MTNKPRNIGTKAETAVVRYLAANGWPYAERRSLKGTHDQGDITGTPGLVWEVKGGKAAWEASDLDIEIWLGETATERVNANADYGFLVVQRKGVGPANAGRWWAWLPSLFLVELMEPDAPHPHYDDQPRGIPVRLLLADLCQLLRWAGYGTPPAPEVTVLSSTDDGVHDALVDAFTNPPAYTAPEADRG